MLGFDLIDIHVRDTDQIIVAPLAEFSKMLASDQPRADHADVDVLHVVHPVGDFSRRWPGLIVPPLAIKQASGRLKGRGDPCPRLQRRHRQFDAEAGVGGERVQKRAKRQRAFSRRQPSFARLGDDGDVGCGQVRSGVADLRGTQQFVGDPDQVVRLAAGAAEVQGVDENGAVRLVRLTHDCQGLWQRADGAPAQEFEIDAQAEWLREVAEFGEMRRQPRMVVIVTGCGDRNGAEIGGRLELCGEGLHIDIRRELDEFDIAHADPLRRQDLLERMVGFGSDPRRTTDGRRVDAQANRGEAGARRFGDQCERRKFEGRQMGKAKHQARHLLRPVINPWDNYN